MRTHLTLLTITLILIIDVSMATVTGMPERLATGLDWSETATTELSEIVDLCAEEKEERFEKKWSTYVAQNDLNGTELKDTIDWVSSEAAIQRESYKGKHGDKKALIYLTNPL